MTSHEAGAQSADERARIAALLGQYPDLPASELELVHQWFRKGASALDLGLLASDPAIAPQYRAYRADHYDRIKPADYTRAAIFVGVLVAIVGGIALLMP
jgi:hypothetical protein